MVRLCTLRAHLRFTAVILVVSKLLAFETPQRARHVWLDGTYLKSLISLLMATIRASVTPCFLSCVNNSSLVVFLSSGVLRSPFEVFSVLCGDTFTGTWANSVIARSLVECVSLSTSIKRSPERSLLMVLGSPTKPWIPFWMANVESLERDFSSSPDVIIKNLVKIFFCFENFLPGLFILLKVCLVTIIIFFIRIFSLCRFILSVIHGVLCCFFITLALHPPRSPTRGATCPR